MLPLKLITRYRCLLLCLPILYVMVISITWYGGPSDSHPEHLTRLTHLSSQTATKHMALIPADGIQHAQYLPGAVSRTSSTPHTTDWMENLKQGRNNKPHDFGMPIPRPAKRTTEEIEEFEERSKIPRRVRKGPPKRGRGGDDLKEDVMMRNGGISPPDVRQAKQESDYGDYIDMESSERSKIQPNIQLVAPMDTGDHLDLPESVARVLHPNKNKNASLNRSLPRAIANVNKRHNLKVWTQGTSLTLLYDIKTLLEPLGFRFIDRGQSASCLYSHNCTSQTSAPLLHSDPELQMSDVIMCIRPASVCNRLSAYDKTMIIYIDTRYDLDLTSDLQRENWNSNLKKIASNSRHLVAVTNIYDMEYMRYYTGIEPVIIPPLCQYIQHSYHPTRHSLLLYDVGLPTDLLNKFIGLLVPLLMKSKFPITITRYSSRKGRWEPEELVQFPAMIYLPNQISSLRFTEFFRMNIPMFVPNVELLVSWHLKYHMLHLDTPSYRKRARGDEDPKSKPSKYNRYFPNPKHEDSADSLRVWLSFADVYSFLHAILFNSVEDLVKQFEKYALDGKLAEVSVQMKDRNKAMADFIHKQWTDFLDKLPPK